MHTDIDQLGTSSQEIQPDHLIALLSQREPFFETSLFSHSLPTLDKDFMNEWAKVESTGEAILLARNTPRGSNVKERAHFLAAQLFASWRLGADPESLAKREVLLSEARKNDEMALLESNRQIKALYYRQQYRCLQDFIDIALWREDFLQAKQLVAEYNEVFKKWVDIVGVEYASVGTKVKTMEARTEFQLGNTKRAQQIYAELFQQTERDEAVSRSDILYLLASYLRNFGTREEIESLLSQIESQRENLEEFIDDVNGLIAEIQSTCLQRKYDENTGGCDAEKEQVFTSWVEKLDAENTARLEAEVLEHEIEIDESWAWKQEYYYDFGALETKFREVETKLKEQYPHRYHMALIRIWSEIYKNLDQDAATNVYKDSRNDFLEQTEGDFLEAWRYLQRIHGMSSAATELPGEGDVASAAPREALGGAGFASLGTSTELLQRTKDVLEKHFGGIRKVLRLESRMVSRMLKERSEELYRAFSQVSGADATEDLEEAVHVGVLVLDADSKTILYSNDSLEWTEVENILGNIGERMRRVSQPFFLPNGNPILHAVVIEVEGKIYVFHKGASPEPFLLPEVNALAMLVGGDVEGIYDAKGIEKELMKPDEITKKVLKISEARAQGYMTKVEEWYEAFYGAPLLVDENDEIVILLADYGGGEEVVGTMAVEACDLKSSGALLLTGHPVDDTDYMSVLEKDCFPEKSSDEETKVFEGGAFFIDPFAPEETSLYMFLEASKQAVNNDAKYGLVVRWGAVQKLMEKWEVPYTDIDPPEEDKKISLEERRGKLAAAGLTEEQANHLLKNYVERLHVRAAYLDLAEVIRHLEEKKRTMTSPVPLKEK